MTHSTSNAAQPEALMSDREAIAFLKEAVETPSPSREEGAFAGLLAERLPALGYRAWIDEVGNLVAERGEGPERGLFLGHIDTVPGGPAPRIEEGRLYGRGSVDAKGPLIAFLVALARTPKPQLGGGRVTVIGCVEEEVASSRGARHVVDRPAPPWCIVGEPSGWDAVTLGYKGHLAARMEFVQGRHHGAHEAATAAERALAAWARAEQEAQSFNEGRERLFDQLMLRLISMEAGPDAEGQDRASLRIQLRLGPEHSPEQAQRWLEKALDEAGAQLSFEGAVPAWSGKSQSPLHRALLASIRAEGGRARRLLKTGTADLNIVAPAWGCPALAYGPGDAALDHRPDEHIVLDEFLQGIRVLERALPRLCAS